MKQQSKPQRLVYGETLVELGHEYDTMVVLDADVCSSTQTKHFRDAFPDRFFNVGVAEAHMMSMAAGLAGCGYIPFVNTFALFVSMRAGEQMRAHIAYNNLHVICGAGYAGLSDFADGASHQSVEDIAIARAIPGMTVIVPSDITETRMAVKASIQHDGPVYLRLARSEVFADYDDDHPFEIGKAVTLKDGHDLTLIATGLTVPMAVRAGTVLEQEGINARIIDMHTIKPIDTDAIVSAARDTGGIVTVEEHSIYGGLGSAVCETAAEYYPVPVLRCGIPDRFGESGPREEILERAGITDKHIIELARRLA